MSSFSKKYWVLGGAVALTASGFALKYFLSKSEAASEVK